MAVDGDEENQTVTNEQTPLLNDQASEDQQSDHHSGQDAEEQKQPAAASWYLWRILWAIIAALILALFIKGWIDAGSDVNVNLVPLLTISASLSR
jgi:uncharacterized membrane protein YraQ (UPF0718 family)